MTTHKKQHFIPQCYLKAWCDSNTPHQQTPYVWRFTKDGNEVKKKSPENIFHETDTYTIFDLKGNRNLVLEKGLNQLETQFANLLEKKIKSKIPTTSEEHFILCAFVAAMFARTTARREHNSKTWNRVLETGERLKEKVKNMTPEQRRKIRPVIKSVNEPITLSHNQVENFAKNPMQSFLSAEISNLAIILFQIDFLILETTDKFGFITCDNPCVWFNPEAYKRPPFYQRVSLLNETIEITLPISPQFMILFNRQGYKGKIKIREDMLDEFNRRTRFNAHEYFIVNADMKKDFWFNPGTEPEDSWQKQHTENETNK